MKNRDKEEDADGVKKYIRQNRINNFKTRLSRKKRKSTHKKIKWNENEERFKGRPIDL